MTVELTAVMRNIHAGVTLLMPQQDHPIPARILLRAGDTAP